MTTAMAPDRLNYMPHAGSQWYCPTKTCPAGTWLVERQSGAADLWLVAEAEDANGWWVAAARPICPLCAMDLVCLSLT